MQYNIGCVQVGREEVYLEETVASADDCRMRQLCWSMAARYWLVPQPVRACEVPGPVARVYHDPFFSPLTRSLLPLLQAGWWRDFRSALSGTFATPHLAGPSVAGSNVCT